MKHQRYFNTLLAVLGFSAVGWLAFMHPNWLLWMGIFTAVSGYFLLLLLFLPAGNVVLGERTQRLNGIRWLGKILKAQAVLLILTLSALVAFFGAGPLFAEQTPLGVAFISTVIKEYSRWQWGIFPWGVYGLWGLVIAYSVYLKKGGPYIYQIAKGLWPRRLEAMVKTYAEATTNGATMMALGLTTAALILLFTYFIELIFNIRHFEIPLITILFLSILAPFVSFRLGKKWYRRWYQQRVTLNRIYFYLILILTLALVGAAFANGWVIRHHPEIYQKMLCQHCGNYFANIPLEKRFAIIYWGWWLLWAPLAGSYLARLSQGRTIREYILGVYALPFLLICLWQTSGKEGIEKMLLTIQALPVGLILILLFLSTAFILWRLTQGWRTSDLFFSGYMPVSTNQFRHRIWLSAGSKPIGITKYVPRLYMTVMGTLFLHTTAGWYGVQFQVAAMGFLVINVVYASFNFLIIYFFKDKVWVGNQNIPPFSKEKDLLKDETLFLDTGSNYQK